MPKAYTIPLVCKEKFKEPVHLRGLSSAARHAKQNNMKEEEFVCFATEAFNRSDLRRRGIDGFTASAYNHEAQEFFNKEEHTADYEIGGENCILNENTSKGTLDPWVVKDKVNLTMPYMENQFLTDSQGMLDYSHWNVAEQDTVNAVVENMEPFMGDRSVSGSHKNINIKYGTRKQVMLENCQCVEIWRRRSECKNRCLEKSEERCALELVMSEKCQQNFIFQTKKEKIFNSLMMLLDGWGLFEHPQPKRDGHQGKGNAVTLNKTEGKRVITFLQ